MPEGPSLVILKEEVQAFKGKKVLSASGNSKQDIRRLEGKKIVDFKTWGKHFLICFPKFTVRIHFLLFGKYAINEKKLSPARLSLGFSKGEFNMYNCGLKILEEDLDEMYDWSADVMNEAWDARAARKKLKALPKLLVCDALLDQNIFAGVGNIIKNEVLYRIRVHPKSTVGGLPAHKLSALIREARLYSFDFLAWKKEYTLRKHWLAHTKKTCSRDGTALVKEYLGKTARRTFYCPKCQELFR